MTSKMEIPDWMNEPLRFDTVSVSDFSRGQASKVFREIQEGNIEEYDVLKNNKTVAYIISPEKYWTLSKESEIAQFIRELAAVEGRVYSAEQFLKNYDHWMKDLKGPIPDWLRFAYDDVDEKHKRIIEKAIASEEYAVPLKTEIENISPDDLEKIVSAKVGVIREAVEAKFRKFLDEELEEIIEAETRRLLNNEGIDLDE